MSDNVYEELHAAWVIRLEYLRCRRADPEYVDVEKGRAFTRACRRLFPGRDLAELRQWVDGTKRPGRIGSDCLVNGVFYLSADDAP